MNVVWKEFNDKKGYYISNYGQVKGLKGRILKTFINNSGYEAIKIGKNHYLIHRLVAFYFVDNPNNLDYVDHIDNNQRNNIASNLQWITNQDNVIKASNHIKNTKGHDIAYKARKVLSVKSLKPVKQIDLWGNTLAVFTSAKEAESKLYKNKASHINQVCNGQLALDNGYIWKYINKSDIKEVKNKLSVERKQQLIEIAQLHKSPVYGFDSKGILKRYYTTYDDALKQVDINKDTFRKLIQAKKLNYLGLRWVLVRRLD